LAVRRHAENRERARDPLDVTAPAHEVYGVGDAERGRRTLECRSLATVAHQHERGPRRVGGHFHQSCKRLHHNAVSLDWLETAHTANDRRGGIDTNLAPEVALVGPRRILLRVHAIVNHADSRWVMDNSLDAIAQLCGYTYHGIRSA